MPMTEADDPYCLREGEAARLLAGHPWKRFTVLGDSVAQGVGDPVPGYSDLPWCDRIAAELGVHQPDLAYLNLGAGDARASHVLATQLEPALAFRPDLAIVVCGGNDAMRSSYDPDAVNAVLERLVTALQSAGADVITVSMFDITQAPAFPEKLLKHARERMLRLSAQTAALAQRLGTIHVHCTGHPAERDPDVYSVDGIHATMRVHQICAAIAIHRLGIYLGR
jgi:lysophospholipase L1-like esterase